MEYQHEKTVSVLKELLEFVNDGIKGYNTAADETTDEHLRSFCLQHALEREEFADEISRIIKNCGGEPENNGTIKGALYRQWMDVKATFTNSDDDAITASCLYGEEWALRAYEDAMTQSFDLTAEAKTCVVQQRQKIEIAYEELKEMEALHHH